MKSSIALAITLGVTGLTLTAEAAPEPKRLKRADSFFGLHFDFHAGKDCTEIGKNTTRAMIENLITQAKPDYLQIDCKGHPGLSSYPTKAGNQAPGFVGDPLKLWREVTREHGVALYMHYSGVWDNEAVRLHPEWAVINADGKPSDRITSVFGPYVDQLLIPQLRELAGGYGVDGVWVDGECWATLPDYGEAAVAAFHAQTGIQTVPKKRGDTGWFEWMDFHREAFRKYLRHYIAEVKRTNPDFQLCSNWAFTDHMAEPVSAPVDFLSGDYSPEDSINSARLSGRFLARQGKPWDLMAWSFSRRPGKNGSNQKSAVQLQGEAAVVIALGGGFQAYFTQKRDGSIREERVPIMAELAKFCRERQAICHHAEAVPQVALLLSKAAHYRKINGLFARDLARVNGVLEALLENQLSVEVLGEHHLQGRLAQYPLVVVPEWDYLEPGFKADLVKYVKSGGNLLLIGAGSAALFQNELGVTFDGSATTEPRFLANHGALEAVKGQVQSVGLGRSAKAFGQLHVADHATSAAQPAATITPLGKGKIAATYFNLGQMYNGTRGEVSRQFLAGLTQQLFPNPMVTVQGSSRVDVSVARQPGKLLVNLVNTSAPHQTEPIFDAIPALGPLDITVQLKKKPKAIVRQPAGEALAVRYEKGAARITLPRLEIHDVLVVEE